MFQFSDSAWAPVHFDEEPDLPSLVACPAPAGCWLHFRPGGVCLLAQVPEWQCGHKGMVLLKFKSQYRAPNHKVPKVI